MKVIHITSQSEFKSMKEEWESLHQQSSNKSIFMTWEWLYSWWEVFKDKRELWLLLCRDEENKLIGAAPFYKENCRGALMVLRRELKFLGVGSPVSPEHLDLLSKKGYEEEVTQKMAVYLSENHESWDNLFMTDITDPKALSFKLMKSLSNQGAKASKDEQKPSAFFIPLPDNWEGYRKALSKNMRKTISQHRKKLFEQSPAAHYEVWTREKESFDDAFDQFVQLFIARKTSVGLDNKFKEKGYEAFHRLAARRFADRGWLHLAFIKCQRETVAAIYCFKYRGTLYDYQSGFRPEMKSEQLIPILRSCVIEQAIHEGMTEFDYLRGEEMYKLRWSAKKRQKFTLKCFTPSLRGTTLYKISEGKAMLKKAAAHVKKKEVLSHV